MIHKPGKSGHGLLGAKSGLRIIKVTRQVRVSFKHTLHSASSYKDSPWLNDVGRY